MSRRSTIWIIVKIDKIEGNIVCRIEEQAEEDIGMVKNSVIDSDMETRCNAFVNVNSNLRIVSWSGKTFPVWMNRCAKNFDSVGCINVSNTSVYFALKFLKEKEIIRPIRESVKKSQGSVMRFLDILEEE